MPIVTGAKLIAGIVALAMLAVVLVAARGIAGSAPARAPVAAPAPHPALPRPAPRKPVPPAQPAPQTRPLPAPSFVLKRVLDVPAPFRHGDWVWDDAGVPPGRLIITVDLEAEVLSAFRDGHEIGAAVILYGADWKPTPLGAYPITQKDATHRSNLYGGAPMPYMLRLTNDGVAIHGSDVQLGAATHGCIGVPNAFARKLFAVAKLGDTVIVTRGKRMALGDAIAAK